MIGVLMGSFIGLVYGYSILSSVMHDTNVGIAVGGLMGVGLGSVVVIALQGQDRFGR